MDAQKVLEQVWAAGLDAPILAGHDLRWGRLKFEPAPGMDLRDRFRGTLVGGAIGDAMGRPNERVPAAVARQRRIRDSQAWGINWVPDTIFPRSGTRDPQENLIGHLISGGGGRHPEGNKMENLAGRFHQPRGTEGAHRFQASQSSTCSLGTQRRGSS
jgi:hypothetical protein